MWVFCAYKSVAQPAVRLGFSDSYGVSPTSRLKFMQVTELLKWTSCFAMILDYWHRAGARTEDTEIVSYSF